VKTTLADLTDTVTDVVGDAWSAGSHFAHDLASTTADRASSLATATAHTVPELPDRVADLVDSAKKRFTPTPKRRVSPWFLVIAAVVAFVGVGWYLRRGRDDVAFDRGPAGGVDPASTNRATGAVAGD